MKTLHRNSYLSTILFAAALVVLSAPLRAQNFWTGNAGTTNWSDAGNWAFGVSPGTADSVVFDSAYGGSLPTQGAVNNIVNNPFTISTLGFDTLTTSGYYTMQINPGITLSVVPQTAGANALSVGSWAGSGVPAAGAGVNDQIYGTIQGGGSLVVNNPSTTIRLEQGQANAGTHNATLDLSKLNSFTATVSNILIGANVGINRNVGTFILATNNTITTGPMGATVPGIMLGSDNTDGGNAILTLGKVNVFNTDWLAVGGYRANGANNTVAFGAGISGGSIKVRGSSGGSARASLISVGDMEGNENGTQAFLGGTSRSQTGVVDFRGAAVDIMVDSLVLGRNLTTNETTAAGGFNTGANGTGTGTMSMDAGIVDANNVYLGYKVGTNYSGANGTLNLLGGVLNVNNNITLSSRTVVNGSLNNGSSGTGTLNVSSNATANVQGDVVKGSGSTATINLTFGGLLNLKPEGDSLAGNLTVDNVNITSAALVNPANVTINSTLNLNSGTISNSSTLTAATIAGSGTLTNIANVTNGTALTLGSTIAAGSLGVGGNLTLKTNASLTFALTTASTTGGGVNSYLNLSGNLALLSNNVVNIAPLAPLGAGPYRLIDYGGALSGLPILLTNTTRYSLGLDTSVTGQINLTNGGGSPVALTWKGAATTGGTNWNVLSSTNWNNNAEPFFQADGVTFDNNGVTTNINLAGLLYPQSITVNDTRNYLLGGSGKISGNTGITKNNTGSLWITNTGGNDFTGPIAINAGILKVGRADAFGLTNGSTTIASGAMLDLAGTGCNSPGEFVTISGAGPTNGGAIINTGGDQNNGLRYVGLAADASIGNWPGRWDVRGPAGNGSFSGGLYLNGFTLTKLGAGRISIVDAVVTNSGSIVVSNGSFAFTRSFVDGPGTITVQGTSIFALENCTTGYVAKPVIFSGAGTLQIPGGSPAFTLFSPITDPYMVEKFGYKPGDFPVCEYVSARTLALPFFSRMTGKQVERVCTVLEKTLEKLLVGRKGRF